MMTLLELLLPNLPPPLVSSQPGVYQRKRAGQPDKEAARVHGFYAEHPLHSTALALDIHEYQDLRISAYPIRSSSILKIE